MSTEIVMSCIRPVTRTWITRVAVLWVRRARVVLCCAPMLLASHASAQALRSFEDLALRVNLDDQVQVEDRSGGKATGRLARLTRDEIVLQTDAGEQGFSADTIHQVAVRGHALRKGALVGAGVFAILGAAATCANEGGAGCAFIGLRAAPIGVGVGVAIAALIPRMLPVYRAPEHRVPAPPSRAASGVQASPLEDLALRVNLNDRLLVEDASGGTISGRLTHLTADEIAIQTVAGERRFTRETLRQVAVRRQPLRLAVLIGAGAGAATGAVAACKGPERDECADAPIIGGAFGAGLGLAVGALMHRTTIVYPGAATRTLMLPVMSRDAVGVRISRRW